MEDALLHRLRGAQIGLAHNHVDLAAERGEVGGLLAGRVAAADHRHILLAVEEAVARGAGAHAHPPEARLRRKAQVLGRGARRDNQRLGPELLLSVDLDAEGALREVDARYDARAYVGAEALGLTPQVGHHLVAVHPLGIAREVFDFGGGGELSAGLDALVEYGRQVGARGVDARGVSRRAAAYNQDFDLFHVLYGLLVFVIRNLLRRRFAAWRVIRRDGAPLHRPPAPPRRARQGVRSG